MTQSENKPVQCKPAGKRWETDAIVRELHAIREESLAARHISGAPRETALTQNSGGGRGRPRRCALSKSPWSPGSRRGRSELFCGPYFGFHDGSLVFVGGILANLSSLFFV